MAKNIYKTAGIPTCLSPIAKNWRKEIFPLCRTDCQYGVLVLHGSPDAGIFQNSKARPKQENYIF